MFVNLGVVFAYTCAVVIGVLHLVVFVANWCSESVNRGTLTWWQLLSLLGLKGAVFIGFKLRVDSDLAVEVS